MRRIGTGDWRPCWSRGCDGRGPLQKYTFSKHRLGLRLLLLSVLSSVVVCTTLAAAMVTCAPSVSASSGYASVLVARRFIRGGRRICWVGHGDGGGGGGGGGDSIRRMSNGEV